MSETSGTITYDSHLTLPDRLVRAFNAVEKNVADIRNSCVVKYQRDGNPITLPCIGLGGGGGTYMFVTLDPTARDVRTVLQMQQGEAFEIFGCPDNDANGKFTVASTPLTLTFLGVSYNVLQSTETVANAISATSAGFKSEFIRYRSAYSCNTVSIGKYGLRECAIYEGSSGNIDTAQEASSLAANVVTDLAEPTANVAATIQCAPWFELHDLVTLSPDLKQRWTADLDAAVVGVKHHFEGDQSFTELTLRAATTTQATSAFTTSAAAPTGGVKWVRRIDVRTTRQAISDKINQSVDLNLLGPQLGGKISQSISVPVKPPFGQGSRGKASLRTDYLEMHLSTDPNFIPNADTLAHAGRGT